MDINHFLLSVQAREDIWAVPFILECEHFCGTPEATPQLVWWVRVVYQHQYQLVSSNAGCNHTVYHVFTNSKALLLHLCQHHSEPVSHPWYEYELPFTSSLSRRHRSHLAQLQSHGSRNPKPLFHLSNSLPSSGKKKSPISPIKGCQL